MPHSVHWLTCKVQSLDLVSHPRLSRWYASKLGYWLYVPSSGGRAIFHSFSSYRVQDQAIVRMNRDRSRRKESHLIQSKACRLNPPPTLAKETKLSDNRSVLAIYRIFYRWIHLLRLTICCKWFWIVSESDHETCMSTSSISLTPISTNHKSVDGLTKLIHVIYSRQYVDDCCRKRSSNATNQAWSWPRSLPSLQECRTTQDS